MSGLQHDGVSSDTLAAIDQSIRRACIREATAIKLGNVHPHASFADLSIDDFLQAADAASPHLARAANIGVGKAVLEAVTASVARTKSNANLGICLLIAPLAAAAARGPIHDHIGHVLDDLNASDAKSIYEAIRRSNPGGLGSSPTHDVYRDQATDIIAAMRLAEDRDRIARQYTMGFHDVLHVIVPAMRGIAASNDQIAFARIAKVQLDLLAQWPDSLIERKLGPAAARHVQQWAQRLQSIARSAAIPQVGSNQWTSMANLLAIAPHWQAFDQYLRSQSNQLNPGTTADLIAAGLFAEEWELHEHAHVSR
jgi:triphosphoribosyl-dephospho-CoA synthase